MVSLRAALAAVTVCLGLAPSAATAAAPFSFGFAPDQSTAFAVAAGPDGDRLAVEATGSGEVLTARRLVPGERRAGEARELDARRGSARIVDRVALVYNPRVREYLLVYYWWSQAEGSTELLAQRIAPDGSPRGDERPISHGRPADLAPSRPEVVYEPATGGYLVAWNAQKSAASTFTLYTQRLDRGARPVSSRDTKVGKVGPTAPRQVVRDGADGTFLVAMIAIGSKRPLVTRRLDRAGRPLGGERRHAEVRSNDLRVAYSPRARRFVVALENGGMTPQAVDVRTLSRGGTKLGGPLRMRAPDSAAGVDLTGLEYAARGDRLLLTWAFVDDRFHQGYLTYPRAKRIRADGRGVAGRRMSFGSESGGATGPFATYDRDSGRHLVLWADRDPERDAAALFGRLVGP